MNTIDTIAILTIFNFVMLGIIWGYSINILKKLRGIKA